MATKRQVDAINRYAAIMEEAKIRLLHIDVALSGGMRLPGPMVREFCFLQLRFVCELIALGCLVAHGDIEATQSGKLWKEYSADKILAQLEALHPTFYPEPARQDPSDRLSLIALKSGFLTKAELPALYGTCGNFLHRGSLKKLLSPKTLAETHFPDIVSWATKIETLLRLHLIALSDGKTKVVCMLHDASNANRVQVVIAEKSEPP